MPTVDEVGVQRIRPQNWHVTLRFVGNADVAAVTERLAAVELPTAEAVLGPAVERLGRNHLVIPVAGLEELAVVVTTATSGLGRPPRPRFVGHLSIARTRREAPSSLVGMPFTAAFAVREIALVSSEPTPAGSEYTTVATFATPGS